MPFMRKFGVVASIIGFSSGWCVAQEVPPFPKCNLDPPPNSLVLATADHETSDTPRAGEGFSSASTVPARIDASPVSDDLLSKTRVLAHIAASGAKIVDLGEAHGLRMVLAKKGDEFMLFQVAPDGEAVVAGIQADLPATKLAAILGSQVTDIGEAHGLRGLLLRNGSRFQVVYETPDRERVIAGVMWDAGGKNLTKAQIASAEGMNPSVVIGDEQRAGSREGKGGLDLIEQVSFGTLGQSGAPRLWVFVDPLCGYSVRALEALRPIVASGKIEVGVVPIAVLDDGRGKSTEAALAMLSRPTDKMVEAWLKRDLAGEPREEAKVKLQVNMAVGRALGLRGTPLFVWQKPDGSEGRMEGLPSDWRAITETIGGLHHVTR